MADWDAASLNAAVADTRFAGTVQVFASVASTNTLAIEAAQKGARTGVWVADEQTAGRGRGGHVWHSAAGNGLYVSAIVVPHVSATRALWLSLATGLAAGAAIGKVSGLVPDIRWPNDLLLGGRKCGGILVESALQAGAAAASSLRYAVIGIGINVGHASFPHELRGMATSLRLEADREIAREDLLPELLRMLDRELDLLEVTRDGGGLLERFAAASTWVRGKQVSVGSESGGYTGVTAGLTPDGFLRVVAEDGTERIVLAGGVRERQ